MVIERSITAYGIASGLAAWRLSASLRRAAFIYLSFLLSYILLVILYPYKLVPVIFTEDYRKNSYISLNL